MFYKISKLYAGGICIGTVSNIDMQREEREIQNKRNNNRFGRQTPVQNLINAINTLMFASIVTIHRSKPIITCCML